MNKKILHISLRSDIGGGPEHMYQLIKKLKDDGGFKIYVGAPNQKPYFNLFKGVVGSQYFILPERMFDLSFFIQLVKFVKNNQIQVVHSHGKGAGVYSRMLKMLIPQIKVIHTFHGWHVGDYNFIMKQLYILIELFFKYFTEHFICVSNSEFKVIPNRLKLNSRKFSVIPNGVILSESILPFHSRMIDVVIITRFDYQKNFELCLKIAQSLPTVKFVTLGHISASGIKYVDFCHEHNVRNIDFVGGTSNVRNYLRNSKIILSTSRWEGLSLGILEGMSEGCVPVLSNVTGNNELPLEKELFFEISDFQYASETILSLVQQQKKWQKHSKKCIDLISQSYSLDNMLKSVKALYNTF